MRLSPRAYRGVTLVALLLLSAIIVSGGAVRVTGSGLGCPDWPTCENGRVVASQLFSESTGHRTIENVNRMITGLVSVAVILAVLGSLVRAPRRRDLTALSVGLVVGVVGQIVLGGVTVLTHLHPVAVQSHFLLSLVIVVAAVTLHWRAGTDPGASRLLVPERVRDLSRLALALLVCAIVAGTVMTGTGPHAGSSRGDDPVRRFAYDPRSVARVHGVLVELFTAALLATLVLAWRRGAPAAVLRRGSAVLAIAIGQSALGYTQYFTGVPAFLVGLHILGATTLWIATLRWHLGLTATARDTGAPAAAAPGWLARRHAGAGAGRVAPPPAPGAT
jgi:cytochrome c oxidase assembly protein subunit 15